MIACRRAWSSEPHAAVENVSRRTRRGAESGWWRPEYVTELQRMRETRAEVSGLPSLLVGLALDTQRRSWWL